MPRRGRVVLAGYPHHVIQRGHNRSVVFISDEDYLYYLANLKEWKEKLGCKVYAYCLMGNHVHLVIDPCAQASGLSLLMKRLAGRQTRYVNVLEKRCGTLWEGRYKSSPIGDEDHLLACCRYVELNPVRAGVVKKPEDYRWSSYRHKAGFGAGNIIDFHPGYLSMGEKSQERQKSYRRWICETVPVWEWKLIREAVQRGQLTGPKKFADEVESRLKIRVELRGRGRPRKDKK